MQMGTEIEYTLTSVGPPMAMYGNGATAASMVLVNKPTGQTSSILSAASPFDVHSRKTLDLAIDTVQLKHERLT